MDQNLTDRIRHDAECLAIDCLYAEKTHFVYATALRRTALWGGIVAAVLAAEAGLSGVGDFLPGTVIGILALISTVITTFVTAAKPGELSEQHHSRGVEFNTLRLKLRRFIHIELAMPNLESDGAAAKLAELAALKSDLAKQQPPTPTGIWYRLAKKSVAKGDAIHEKNRVFAAVGSGN